MSGSVIVAGARTPIGKLSGSLGGFAATELGGFAIAGALERAGIKPEQVDYVFMGQVIQAGAGQITARQAAAKRTDYGCSRPSPPIANLSARQAADHSTSKRAEARGGFCGLHSVHGNDLAGIWVYSGGSGVCRSGRRATGFIRCSVLSRRAHVMGTRHWASRRCARRLGRHTRLQSV